MKPETGLLSFRSVNTTPPVQKSKF